MPAGASPGGSSRSSARGGSPASWRTSGGSRATRGVPGRPAHRRILEEVGAVEHFADPELYDLTYADRTEDVAMYVALAREHGGPVLELGSGTGRITLPMARAGVPVVAVDRVPAVVDALRGRLRTEPLPVRVRQADLRTFRPRSRFPLVICPFNTFLHLWTREDAHRALVGIRRALAPGGRFVFDASVPRPADLARDPERWMRAGSVRWRGRRWRYAERFAYEPLEQILYVTMRFDPGGGREPVRQLLAHRQWFPAELEALLHAERFDVEHVWGGFDRRPAAGDPDTLVWVCVKAV